MELSSFIFDGVSVFLRMKSFANVHLAVAIAGTPSWGLKMDIDTDRMVISNQGITSFIEVVFKLSHAPHKAQTFSVNLLTIVQQMLGSRYKSNRFV